jgi:hypothetical protein
MRAKFFGEAEASSLLQLRAEIVGREFVRFVESGKVPAWRTELVLKLLIAGKLVESNDEAGIVVEGVTAGRSLLQKR